MSELEVVSKRTAEAAVLYSPEDLEPPRPLTEFIVKTDSRCNLACTYCYMYELADQSWRDQPVSMDKRTVVQTAVRIAEHSEAYNTDEALVVFHGGEPLLAEKRDPDFYRWATGVFRNVVGEAVGRENVRFLMQTNGTLITPIVLEKMVALGISLGVSIDGPMHIHDSARIYRNGKGSYAEARRGLRLLGRREYNAAYGGLLCVINTDADPLITYNGLKSFAPPVMDLLLPLAHWNEKPPAYGNTDSETPYADWLIPIFDTRRAEKQPQRVRIFDEIVRMLKGGRGSAEYFGLTQPSNVVIETDGQIQLVDALKSTVAGAPATGLNVFENAFDELFEHPKALSRRLGRAALAQQCNDCAILEVCGGGYQPHRYRADSEGGGFRNPSVYCADLQKLIGHITARVNSDYQDATLEALAQQPA